MKKGNLTRFSSKIDFGILSGASISTLYSVCRRYDVEVVSAVKLGGIFVKTYHVTLEGTRLNIARVLRVFS